MSHFSVLVVGDDIDKQLQPFHEFECTGTDDEYVQDIDVTDKLRNEYESHTNTRYKDPEGNHHCTYEERFYRDPTAEESEKIGPLAGTGCGSGLSWSSKDWGDGRGYRTKVHFIPEGWSEVQVPAPECESFAEFIEGWSGQAVLPFGEEPDLEKTHKYGYVLVDAEDAVVKVIDRTNPAKRWDWWVMGGRWSGHFKLKAGATGELGKPGVFDNKAEPGHADQARKRDIDFNAMRAAYIEGQLKKYRQFHEIVAGRPVPNWAAIREKHAGNIDAAREEYNGDPVTKDIRSARDLWIEDFADWDMPVEQFVARESKNAICTFAVLKDGQWHQRGDMGWWGAVHDEKPEGEWEDQFAALLDSVPDDTLLTVVDCHI